MWILAYTGSLDIQNYWLSSPNSRIIQIGALYQLLFTPIMKSIDLETQEWARDGGYASFASLRGWNDNPFSVYRQNPKIRQNAELDKIPNWTKSQIDTIPNWTKSRTKSQIGQNPEMDKISDNIPNRTKSQMDEISNEKIQNRTNFRNRESQD